MEKKTYSERLRDPRWQRKRLEILNRSDFSCERCGATDRTLNVHHKRYRKGAMPWEYEATELVALCEICHQQHHSLANTLSEIIGELDEYETDLVVGYLKGVLYDRVWEDDDYRTRKPLTIANPVEALGLADFLAIGPHDPEYEKLSQPELTPSEFLDIQMSVGERLRAKGKAERGEN